MPDVRDARVRVVVSALLALLAVSTPTAQKQTSEKSPGTGVTVTRYLNPDGEVYRSEFVDAKGILFKVETSTWDPDPPHGLQQLTTNVYRDDGTLSDDIMEIYDGKGHRLRNWYRTYDRDGHQTSGTSHDFQTHITSRWDPASDTYEPMEAPPSPPTPKKPGDVSLQPTDLALLLPSNLKPGETFTASVMPAAEGADFKGVPGFTVKPFTVQLPGGQFSADESQGLTIGTSSSAATPVLDGYFTATTPTSGSLTLFAGQVNKPQESPIRISLDTGVPAWIHEPVIQPPVWQGDEQAYWLDYLNYLWFKVTDFEDEYWDAESRGAPGWVLDEIEDDQDDAQDVADYLASHLPLDAVRGLAQKKAALERWLDESFHGGLSLTHKDNVDYYQNYAVPLDYFVRRALHAVVAQPMLQVGRLSVLRGDFAGDARGLRVDIDGSPVRPMASNESSYYFLPPDSIMPGPHTMHVMNGPFGYRFPVFFMTLSMSIDLAALHTKVFPTSTMWHLTLSGLNGMPSSYWSSAGGYSPDLVAPAELGALPQGLRLNDQSRQGSIVVRITNDSPQIIAVPEISGGARTWVLDAKSFAPAGVFHLDAKASALRDGNFSISGLAVATLKPIEGTPWVPEMSRGLPPGLPSLRQRFEDGLQLISFRRGQGAPTPASQQAARGYVDAQQATKAKRIARNDAWTFASASASPALRTAWESAAKAYEVARSAWQAGRKATTTSSADSRATLEKLTQERLRAKLAFEHAREAILNSVGAQIRDAWQSAVADHKAASTRQAHARVALEKTWRVTGG